MSKEKEKLSASEELQMEVMTLIDEAEKIAEKLFWKSPSRDLTFRVYREVVGDDGIDSGLVAALSEAVTITKEVFGPTGGGSDEPAPAKFVDAVFEVLDRVAFDDEIDDDAVEDLKRAAASCQAKFGDRNLDTVLEIYDLTYCGGEEDDSEDEDEDE